MKMKYPIIFIIVFLISCTTNNKQEKIKSDNETRVLINSNYQTFDKYEIAIKAPCKLVDISNQTNNDFELNYGGIDNEYNKDKMAAYQLMIVKLPVGYKDLPPTTLKKKVDEKLKDMMKSFENVESIKFGYENYLGYVGEATTKGYASKGIFFHRENYIYCLTIISNDNLEERFNMLTNNIKFINTEPSLSLSQKARNKRIDFGRKYENQDFYISYPTNWEIVQENSNMSNTTIALQIMQKHVNNYDFASNVSIIVSPQKWKESTSYLAEMSFKQFKNYAENVKLISKNDAIELSICKGTLTHYTYELQGYHLGVKQYIVKKEDNSTFTITGTYDADNKAISSKEIDKVIQSIVLF